MKFDRVLMGSAHLWATLSTCSRLHVGCVVADDRGKILGSGYNGAPPGQPHCNHVCDCGHDFEDPTGWDWHLSDCPAKSGCKRAVHAEMNAIAFAKQSVTGGTLYATHSPCLGCVNLILAAGIVRVVYSTEYRDTSSLSVLREAGVTVERYEGGLDVLL